MVQYAALHWCAAAIAQSRMPKKVNSDNLFSSVDVRAVLVDRLKKMFYAVENKTFGGRRRTSNRPRPASPDTHYVLLDAGRENLHTFNITIHFCTRKLRRVRQAPPT